MAETSAELGRAVTEALDWLGTSPETGGALLGINARTLSAMAQGIVPMRSLVIKFATAIGGQCERLGGAPDWWRDVDAWLKIAGYPPRREVMPGATLHGPSQPPAAVTQGREVVGGPLSAAAVGAPRFSPPQRQTRPDVRAASPNPQSAIRNPQSPDESAPASEYYHPVYERVVRGEMLAHIFWILDRNDQKAYQMVTPASQDYRARAAQVKQDLAGLTREQFERKYGRFRFERD